MSSTKQHTASDTERKIRLLWLSTWNPLSGSAPAAGPWMVRSGMQQVPLLKRTNSEFLLSLWTKMKPTVYLKYLGWYQHLNSAVLWSLFTAVFNIKKYMMGLCTILQDQFAVPIDNDEPICIIQIREVIDRTKTTFSPRSFLYVSIYLEI